MAPYRVKGVPSQLLIRAIGEKFESPGFPPMKPGENLEARITQKLDGNRVVVMLKGAPVTAEAVMPLQVGQTLQVQVESLQPRILLRVIPGDAGGEQALISGYLKAFRAAPLAMADLFQSAGVLFSPENLKTLPEGLLRDRSDALGRLIRTLIFSTETMKNPLFIRDFLTHSGLLLEHALRKAVLEKGPPPSGNDLKSAMFRLSDEIRSWLAGRPDIRDGETGALLRLADFADRSVRHLETGQVLNVVSGERDSRFMVQIPFAFPHGPAMQDIFIEFGGRGDETEKEEGAPLRVVFFLNLEALGEMMIDLGVREREVTADLLCQNVDTSALVTAHLAELEESLQALGFQVMRMTCGVRDDVEAAKRDYLRDASWHEERAINLFA
ncbi:MAG: flagellar hook-length control protein FliK [Deltaproteobacteria bacterium]|nr:flagellar hook-length control protein FliK [Deltaproteobacteria bacterium]